jgi:outer membrane receptor for ferrienterochelin and colicins
MRFFRARPGLLGLIALLALFFAFDRCVAQAQPDQDVMTLNIEDLARVKVYSASRHEEEVRDAPASVSVITAEEIQRYGWRTLGEALGSLRGYYTSYDRNYTYLGVRGFLRPGDYNSRILLLIDGHRLNDNVFGSAEMGTEFPLDLDLIDHIEVVRGPGSSLFGTNAVFGVINIITRRPAARSAVETAGDISSFLSRTGRITAQATRGNWSGLLSGTLYESAGQSRLFFPEFASPANNGGFADNLDGDRCAQIFSDLQYGNLRVESLYSSRRKIIPTATYATNFDDPGTRTTDSDMYVDADYTRSLSAQTNLDVRAFYDHYSYYGTYAYGGTNPADRSLEFDSAVADWSGVDATLDHQMGPHHFTVGADYEYSFRVNQKTYYIGQPPVLDDHRTPWQGAIYGEAEFKLGHNFTLHGGGRFDYFNAYGGALSPRAALVYSPNARTALKYIYGRAFRAPNAYESYYQDGMTQERPLHPLQKENIQSHELVFERDLKPWIGLTVDGYYNNLDHLIDWVTDPANGMTHSVNVGQDRGRGLEFELHAKRASGLEARASYALADAYDQINLQRLNNSPLHQAKLNALLPVTPHGFVGLESVYTSAQQSYQETRVPPWFLTNLTLSSKPLWGGWEFSASCYNAFDRRWFSPMQTNAAQAAIQQDGRTFRFKISYRLAKEQRAP